MAENQCAPFISHEETHRIYASLRIPTPELSNPLSNTLLNTMPFGSTFGASEQPPRLCFCFSVAEFLACKGEQPPICLHLSISAS